MSASILPLGIVLRDYLFPLTIIVLAIGYFSARWLNSWYDLLDRVPIQIRRLVNRSPIKLEIPEYRFKLFIILSLAVWTLDYGFDWALSTGPLTAVGLSAVSVTGIGLTLVSVSGTFLAVENYYQKNDINEKSDDLETRLEALDEAIGEYTDGEDGEQGFVSEFVALAEEFNRQSLQDWISQTSENTDNINKNLKKIKTKVNKAKSNSKENNQYLNDIETQISNVQDFASDISSDANEISRQVGLIQEFADNYKQEIESISDHVESINTASENITESQNELQTQVGNLSDDIGSFKKTSDSLSEHTEALTTTTNKLKEIMQEPFSGDHFEQIPIDSILEQFEFTHSDDQSFADYLIEIPTEEEDITPVIAVTAIDVTNTYEELIGLEESDERDSKARQLRIEAEKEVEMFMEDCFTAEDADVDLAIAYFETENIYHNVVRLLSSSRPTDSGEDLASFADKGVMLASPATLTAKFQMIETNARAWYWYHAAHAARDELDSMQEEVRELFADVESVRDSVSTVNAVLEADREPPTLDDTASE